MNLWLVDAAENMHYQKQNEALERHLENVSDANCDEWGGNNIGLISRDGDHAEFGA